MELCSHFHEEVCFDSRACPVCEVKSQLEEKEQEVKNLEADLEKVQTELDNALADLDNSDE